jgi:hypothetical protein
MSSINRRMGLAILATLVALGSTQVNSATPSKASYQEEVTAGLEEIFVFRTTRSAQERGATPACAPAPFATVSEDRYNLWSIQLRASDSRVVKTHEKPVGDFRACFSQLAEGKPLNMYAMGTVASVPWVGVGECLITKAQPPVRTVLALNCQLALSGLPEGYTGGLVTSSSLAPLLGREQGPTAHVPGYLSTSVVTIRLWKKPAEAAAR